MTEPYMVLLIGLALLLILRFSKKINLSTFNIATLGILLGLIPWVRQSGGISMIILIGLYLALCGRGARTPRAVATLLAGVCLPGVIIVIIWVSGGHLGDLVSNIIVGPTSGSLESSNPPLYLRLGYFSDISTAALPLYALYVIAFIPVVKAGTNVARWALALFSSWIGAVMIVNLYTPLTGGYQHEYFEILLPLSLIAGFALVWLVREVRYWLSAVTHPPAMSAVSSIRPLRAPKASRHARVELTWAAISLASVLILSGVSASSYMSEALSNYKSPDISVIDSIARFIDSNTPPGQPTYVFETEWPKIAVSVYYVAQRDPPLNDLFYFPPEMTSLQASQLIHSLNTSNTKVVVVIGTRPSTAEAAEVYDYIELSYHGVKEFGYWQPYSWLPPEPVLGMLIDSSSPATLVQTVALTGPTTLAGAPVNATLKGSGASFQFRLETQNWFTLFFQGISCNDSQGNTSLELYWVSSPQATGIEFDYIQNASHVVRISVSPWTNGTIIGYIPVPSCLPTNSSWQSINVSYVGQEGVDGSGFIALSLVRFG